MCAGASWTQLCIGVLIHGVRGRKRAYLWVIGIGRVRGQGHGRNSNDMGRELSSLWPIHCLFIFV